MGSRSTESESVFFFTSEAEAKEELKKWEVPGHVQVELPFGDLARIEIGGKDLLT
jgi:hypothetical protein